MRNGRAALDPPIPAQIGGYRVDGLLGRGGTGIVFRVYDETLERPLALKLLADDLDDDARARFMVEARAAGRIIHPNVVQVYAVGVHEGRTYITQELVEGHPLSSLLEVRGKLSATAVIDIGIQAARGLARAAEVGVVHRDVKPQNLLVTDEGLVKLADFGLAKLLHAPSALTDAGTTLGTPHYMSPEQGLAQDLDERSDQYSLGATLYHLVSGQTPFDADNALALLLMHVQAPLPPVGSVDPTCPEDLAAVIARMLAKDRDQRFASFAEVIEALEAAQRDLPSDTEEDAECPQCGAGEPAAERAPMVATPRSGRAAYRPYAPLGVASATDERQSRLLAALGVAAALAVVGVTTIESETSGVTTGRKLEASGPSAAGAGRAGAPSSSARGLVGAAPGSAPDPRVAEPPAAGDTARAEAPPDRPMAQEPSVPRSRPAGVAIAVTPQPTARGALALPSGVSGPPAGIAPAPAAMPASDAPLLTAEATPGPGAGARTARLDRLIEDLGHGPEAAERAARKLGELRDQAATMPLVHLLEAGASPRLRVAAADALGELGDLRALEPLQQAAELSPSPAVRAAARRAERQLFSVDDGR